LVEDLEKVSKIAPEPEVVSKNGFRRRWIWWRKGEWEEIGY
jgi:hypothetical protein